MTDLAVDYRLKEAKDMDKNRCSTPNQDTSAPSVARFTPGPWVADDVFMESGRRVRVGTYNGRDDYYIRSTTVCECCVTEDEDEDDPRIGVVTAERNARLIAAAPDLFKAAMAVVAANDAADSPEDMLKVIDAIDALRAALSKAAPQTGPVSDGTTSNTDTSTK